MAAALTLAAATGAVAATKKHGKPSKAAAGSYAGPARFTSGPAEGGTRVPAGSPEPPYDRAKGRGY